MNFTRKDRALAYVSLVSLGHDYYAHRNRYCSSVGELRGARGGPVLKINESGSFAKNPYFFIYMSDPQTNSIFCCEPLSAFE